jgi:hypothetical protein
VNRKHLLTLLIGLALIPLARGQGDGGPIKATMRLRPDGTRATTVVDPEKRSAEETITTSNGKMIQKTVFQLDDRDLATSATHYDSKGSVYYKDTYNRDDNDRIVESSFSDAKGKPLGKRVFVYLGDKVSIEDYDADGNRIMPAKPASPSKPDKHRR